MPFKPFSAQRDRLFAGVRRALRQVGRGTAEALPLGPAVFHSPEVPTTVAELFAHRPGVAEHHILRLDQERVTDELTGAKNRKGFKDRLSHIAWTQAQPGASGRIIGMVSWDFVGFKHFNNLDPTYVLGDEVLTAFVRGTQAALRDLGWTDTDIYRPGGDEFILVGERDFDAHELKLLSEAMELCITAELRSMPAVLEFSVQAAAFRFGAASTDYGYRPGSQRTMEDLRHQLKVANVMTKLAKHHPLERRAGRGQAPEQEQRGDFQTYYGEVVAGDPEKLHRDPRKEIDTDVTPEEQAAEWAAIIDEANEVAAAGMNPSGVRSPLSLS